MMRNRLFPGFLQLFHLVVQKEVDQYSINVCFRVVSLDLSPDELNTPDAAGYESVRIDELVNVGDGTKLTSQLHLPRTPIC